MSIFSRLGRYRVSDENYLTEAFVLFLSVFLDKEKENCCKFLNSICSFKKECCFLKNQKIDILTQQTASELGRPDIKISSPSALVYIEVKDNSGLGGSQIRRYKAALQRSGFPITRMVLLTRFSNDFSEDEIPDRDIRWHDIYDWLSKLCVSDTLTVYFKDQFLEFLREKKMDLQKVTSGLIEGISACKNFVDLLASAVESAGFKIHQRSLGNEWMGIYIVNNRNFCGIFYDNPSVMKYQIDKDGNGRWKDCSSIDLSKNFFDMDKKQQLERITEFIKMSYQGDAIRSK